MPRAIAASSLVSPCQPRLNHRSDAKTKMRRPSHHDGFSAGVDDLLARGFGARERRDAHAVGDEAANEVAA